MPEEYDKALKLKEAGFQDIEAIDTCKIDDEKLSNAIMLKKSGFEGRYAIHGAKTLASETVKNAIKLKNAGFGDSSSISNASSLSSQQVELVLNLRQQGFNDFYSVQGALLGAEKAETAIKLKKIGYIDTKAIKESSLFSSSQVDSFIEFVKLGFNIDDAKNIITNNDSNAKFEELTANGYDEKTASIMTNIENIEDYDNDVISEFLTSIKATKSTEERVSKLISKFLKDNPDVDLKDLTEYINNIDFEAVSTIAPAVKDFGTKDLLKFDFYHYRAGTTDFTQEELSLDEDFTKYLTDNYVDADMLTDLLTAFPATPREVGSLPEDWLEKIPNELREKKIKDIYSAVSVFQKTANVSTFAKQLSIILQKKADVSELSSGTYGTGYKISVENAKDMCIKIFPKHLEKQNNTPNMHGQHVEVQNAIFANTHSSDFVKMYFGRVASLKQKDGFLVTQFLGGNILPEITGNPKSEYKVTSGDCFMGHNIINGKNIDFGGMIVEKDGVRLNKWI